MKKIFLFLLLTVTISVGFAQSHKRIVVAQDGSGDYTTVQAAFDAIPVDNKKLLEIFIKRGVYKEKLHLDSGKNNVLIIGEVVMGKEQGTILTYDDHTGTIAPDGSVINTQTSQSFYIKANDVKLQYLTIENTAGFTAGQAVAVRVEGDRIFFLDCRILGFQDTLFTSGENSRQFYRDCFIQGSTDFIFGPSTALFDECIIRSKKNSHVTAASTPRDHEFGYVFSRCWLVADSGLNKVSLGRPWRPYASVAYLQCKIESHIFPEGWDNWKNPENEKTVRYYEYKNIGPGADSSARVSWAHQISEEEIKKYTMENILRGWQPYGASYIKSETPWIPRGKPIYAHQ